MSTAMQWFWAFIVFGCLGWYAVTSIYIAVKGAFDIQSMLAHLRPGGSEADKEDSDSGTD